MRLRLLLVLAIALMPFLLIGALQTVLDARTQRIERRDTLLLSADRAISRVEQYNSTAEQFLRLLSEEIGAGHCSEVHDRLQPRLLGLANVVSFDAGGRITCSAQEESYPLTGTQWFGLALMGDDFMQTEAVYGPSAETMIVAFILRRYAPDGSVDGWSAMGLRVDAYLDILRHVDLPAQTQVHLVDRAGRVFGLDEPMILSPDWVEAARLNDRSQLFFQKNDRGQGVNMVVGRIGDQDGTYVVISQPARDLFGEFLLTPMRSIGLPFLALCVTLMTAWLATDLLILSWLKRLRQLAIVYAEGLYDFRNSSVFERAPEEVQSLAVTLNGMAARISERDESLKRAIEVRDDAVKEIHHRVKNNLQIVTSFLNLQSRAVKDEQARAALAAARHRINALAIVHSTLYQNERVELVSVKPFLEGLLNHLNEALGMPDFNIDLDVSILPVELEADAAMPIALFIVEAVTNAMIHAMDKEGGKITVYLRAEGDCLRLCVLEDGLEAPDMLGQDSPIGLGGRLLTSFARQLQGRLVTDRPCDGCSCVGVVFPRGARHRAAA